jgi:hypothetical protein
MMTCTPEDALLPLLTGVVTNGSGVWKAICPIHDDHDPSLTITRTDRGGLVLYCHVCKDPRIDQRVCEALGVKLADICPPKDTSVTSTSNVSTRGVPPLTKGCKLVETYIYRNADGTLNRLVARYEGMIEGERKKNFLQFRPDGQGGWLAGVNGVAEVPYRLPELLAAPLDRCVYVVEGERKVETLVGWGLVATCNHGGANGWKGELARFFDDRDVVVLPDADKPGADHADKVIRSLNGHARLVNIVHLPGLGPKGDIVDWVAAGNTLADLLRVVNEQTNMRDETQKAVSTPVSTPFAKPVKNPEATPPEAPKQISPFVPPPTHCLPEPIRGIVIAAARAIGCDESYIMLPLLAALASAIGSTRVLSLRPTWFAPAILWVLTVGESGSMKSPAFKLATQFHRDRQRSAEKRYEHAFAKHKADVEKWEAEHADGELGEGGDDHDSRRPVAPTFERVLVVDATLESLAPIFLENPRGLFRAVDEAEALFNSFTRYAKNGGSDQGAYLSMYNGDGFTVDRRTGTPRYLSVSHAPLSIAATVQPGTLARTMGVAQRQSGFLARWLMAAPPTRRKKWTEATVDEELVERVRSVFDALFAFDPALDRDGEPYPARVRLSPDAKDEFRRFFERHAERLEAATGDSAAALSKLEEIPGRLALVLHCVQVASGEASDQWECDLDTMRDAIELSEWLIRESERVYAILNDSGVTSGKRKLVDWIAQHGGQVTAREVQQGCSWLKKPGAAQAALDDLVNSGTGEWCERPTGPKGGRATRVFRLFASTEPPFSADPGGFVDVDNVDGHRDSTDWGGAMTEIVLAPHGGNGTR